MPAVNPKILKWARETAGLSLEDAARMLDLKNSKKMAGAEKLSALESGESEPTRQILERMSGKYRRSLLIFYLSEPPIKGDRGQDFRKLSGEAISDSHYLDALIRDIRIRQSLVKSLLEDEEATPLPFVASANMEQDIDSVVEDVVTTLDFQINHFRQQRTHKYAFRYLRRCIEDAGIFVLLAGDLGSSHTYIAAQSFRGFAIADSLAPFVVINHNDADISRSFTALHEVVHIWLGKTGISGQSNEHEVEKFCNEVAGRILLPIEELDKLENIQTLSFDKVVEHITDFAKVRHISRAMVAFSLLNSHKIDVKRWVELDERFAKDWADKKENSKKKDKGGPDYYTVRRQRLGKALIDLVGRSINSGLLSPTKAAKILGVKPINVDNLLNSSLNGGQ